MHTIRLRGPWNLEPLARFVRQADGSIRESIERLPAPGRMTMPADWAEVCGRDFLGRVRYHRIFQTPTGLEAGERVYLVVEPPRSSGKVILNGKRLGEVRDRGSALRADITLLLADHNHLEVLVEHPALVAIGTLNDDNGAAGGLVGEVRLEIEE